MLSKILKVGIDESLGLEAAAKVKLLNAVTLLTIILFSFFTLYHFFYAKDYITATVFLGFFLFAPLPFFLHYKHKYIAARIVLFLFLYFAAFMVSMVLLVGHGNEYYYVVLSVLILFHGKNINSSILLISLNLFLFLLPHFFYPDIQEEYIVSTHVAVYLSVIFAAMFFMNIQNKFRSKLREQKQRLEILNEEKNDLMSIVAHDLKSPLAQIQGLVGLLKIDQDKLTAEQLKLIEKIKDVTDKQYNQITNFLSVKSLEDSIENLVMEQVQVVETVKMVLDEMLQQAAAKKILIKDEYEGDELIIIGSSEGLYKVISNLISNSIKYSHLDSEIHIDVKSDKREVLIMVRDFGQGFKEEEIDQVFMKNKVLSAKPTSDESASGMGLYIVKKYVDRMNGRVWLESEEGKICTFFIRFPRFR
jgi:signal transduction histidine kinase